MRVLVCGGRDYNDEEHVFRTLMELCEEYSTHYHPTENWLPLDITIIHGNATGADQLADAFAVTNYCPVAVYPADWKKYGWSAGPIRNQQMLTEGKPDLVVAFPGGKGTAHMMSIARKAGITVETPH